MRKSLVLAFAALALPVHGCSDLLEVGGDVQLRVENASDQRFDRVTVYTPDGPKVFVDLPAGRRTAYFYVSMSYAYATTEVIVAGDTLRLQVIDFVGEEPLRSGSYTFVFDVIGSGETRSLTQLLHPD